MVEDYVKFEKNGLTVEVNYDEPSKPCKYIKFSLGNEVAILPNADFYMMMMVFGTADVQDAIIPVRETKLKQVTSLLKIRAKKDIRKGETISVAHSYFIGADVVDKIKLTGTSGDAKLDRDLKLDKSVIPAAASEVRKADGNVVS